MEAKHVYGLCCFFGGGMISSRRTISELSLPDKVSTTTHSLVDTVETNGVRLRPHDVHTKE
jgi:hypothetical protein